MMAMKGSVVAANSRRMAWSLPGLGSSMSSILESGCWEMKERTTSAVVSVEGVVDDEDAGEAGALESGESLEGGEEGRAAVVGADSEGERHSWEGNDVVYGAETRKTRSAGPPRGRVGWGCWPGFVATRGEAGRRRLGLRKESGHVKAKRIYDSLRWWWRR
jgi:hypothetical protein